MIILSKFTFLFLFGKSQTMRRKVEDMQRLLAERRNKLKCTEKVIEKKANVVSKVEKILHSK